MIKIPLNDSTLLNEQIVTQWMPGADTRGTADILWTCSVTMILCIWTAVHMNVPPPEATRFQQVLGKIKWTFIGLFAPEILLFAARDQFLQAWKLRKELNEERERHLSRGTLEDPKPGTFNLQYAFFVVMGGFRAHHSPRKYQSRSCVLTPDAVKWLAQRGTFLWVDSRSIQGRSKADNLAKLLVCTQIIWLSVQCIARKVNRLPLTLLEIHTFVHVVCSLVTYSLWFKKPFDTAEATFVDLSANETDHLALSGVFRDIQEVSRNGTPHQRISIHTGDYRPAAKILQNVDSNDIPETTPWHVPRNARKSFGQALAVWTITGSNESTGLVAILRETPSGTFLKVPLFYGDSSNRTQDISRARRAWERAGGRHATSLNMSDHDFFLDNRAANLPNMWAGSAGIGYILGATILIVYGGVHLTAWNSHFPSAIEMWFWRSSALLLAVTTPCCLLAFGTWKIADRMNNEVHYLAFWPLFWLFIAAALCYISARVFLVVKSFISLRSVPVGVYAMILWSEYIPHI